MPNGKLKLCVVGCGMIGRIHCQSCLKLRDDIELYVCDTDEDAARAALAESEAAGMFDTYEEVLSASNIEAVDLCLPHHLHAPAAVAAFEARKHVLLEKPIANSLAEADSIGTAARKANRVFAVSENFRFEPAVKKAREIVERGDIGKPFLIQIQEMSYTVELTTHMRTYDWRRRKSTGGGGVLFDRGVHLMALVNQLGGRVRSVYAVTRCPAQAWEVDETSVALFIHDDGVVTNLIESWNIRSAPKVPMMAIYGTAGSIVEDPDKRLPGHSPFEMGGLVVCSSRRKEFQIPPADDYLGDAKLYMKMVLNAEVPDEVLSRSLTHGTPIDIVGEYGHYNVYEASIMDFAECIRTGKTPHVGGQDARDDIELVFASYESARTGRPVTLPLKEIPQ